MAKATTANSAANVKTALKRYVFAAADAQIVLPFVLTAEKNAQTVPIRKFAEDATPAKTA